MWLLLFLLVQSAAAGAAAVRLRDEGEESKAMVMALPVPRRRERERRMGASGRDPGLCAPVIWEMRKMRRRGGGEGEEGESDRMVFLSE